MEIWVHRGQLDYFRKLARKNSTEIYAILIGKQVTKGEIHVYYFIHPRPSDYEVKKYDEATVSADFVERADTDATAEGLKIVGGIHTHPNWPPIMSPTDHKNHRESGDKITGIVEVSNGRTRVAFWRHDSALPCKLKYFE